MYNRTDSPLFVSSSTLAHPGPFSSSSSSFEDEDDDVRLHPDPSVHTGVLRVPPGYSAEVFDYETSSRHERARRAAGAGAGGGRGGEGWDGPYDPYSVSISFCKGWGKGFKRQDVTLCPCWLQVCLAPPTNSQRR